MSLCPRCGVPIYNDEPCPVCGQELRSPYAPRIFRDGTLSYLESAFRLSLILPRVYTPILIGGIFRGLLELLALNLGYTSTLNRPSLIGSLLFLLGSFWVYLLSFSTIKISSEAYGNKVISPRNSVTYIQNNIGDFLVASILATFFGFNIVMIPIALLMVVIMVQDEKNATLSLRKISNIQEMRDDFIKISILPILGSIIVGSIPVMGGIIQSILLGYTSFAYLCVYLKTETIT